MGERGVSRLKSAGIVPQAQGCFDIRGVLRKEQEKLGKELTNLDSKPQTPARAIVIARLKSRKRAIDNAMNTFGN